MVASGLALTVRPKGFTRKSPLEFRSCLPCLGQAGFEFRVSFFAFRGCPVGNFTRISIFEFQVSVLFECLGL